MLLLPEEGSPGERILPHVRQTLVVCVHHRSVGLLVLRQEEDTPGSHTDGNSAVCTGQVSQVRSGETINLLRINISATSSFP